MTYFLCVNDNELLKKYGFYKDGVYQFLYQIFDAHRVVFANNCGQQYVIDEADFVENFIPHPDPIKTKFYPGKFFTTVTTVPNVVYPASADSLFTNKEGTVNIDDSETSVEVFDPIFNQKFVDNLNHIRMVRNDHYPVPLSHKKVEPAPEFDSKCHLCGQPCNKRGKVSVCEGGCR